MRNVKLSAADVVAVREGPPVYLPRGEEPAVLLFFSQGAYRLQKLVVDVIITSGDVPGVGADAETLPD